MEKQDHHEVAQEKKVEGEHSCYSVVASGDNKEVPSSDTVKNKSKKTRYIIYVAIFIIFFCIGFCVLYYLLMIQSNNSPKKSLKTKSFKTKVSRKYKGSEIQISSKQPSTRRSSFRRKPPTSSKSLPLFYDDSSDDSDNSEKGFD